MSVSSSHFLVSSVGEKSSDIGILPPFGHWWPTLLTVTTANLADDRLEIIFVKFKSVVVVVKSAAAIAACTELWEPHYQINKT